MTREEIERDGEDWIAYSFSPKLVAGFMGEAIRRAAQADNN